MNRLKWFGMVLLCVFLGSPAFAGQGQWAGFLYLAPKSGDALSAEQKAQIVTAFQQAEQGFHNDFTPDAKATDTIQYLKAVDYNLNGKPVSGPVPVALVRVESTQLEKVDGFFGAMALVLDEAFMMDFRLAVTGALNYTDADTLARLKKEAPKRGNGKDQPNAVVFPLSKSADWWGMPADQRTGLFFANEAKYGKGHLGHNGVGFQYIQKIFRKLYQSRFIDPQQDFMTYFEYADADKDTFNSLLNGLRDTQKNQEWKYVQEGPIFWGKRVPGAEGLF